MSIEGHTYMSYELAEFILTNKKELREDIKVNVAKFIARETIFDGMFRLVFEKELEKFIVNELKDVLRKDLLFSEKYVTINNIDVKYLKSLTQIYFFDKSYYIN